MALPKIGNLAPAFSLLDQNGSKVSLKDFRDSKNVVVYFYPKASTPGCTVQACGIRDMKAELEARDTVVLGLSPDPVSRIAKFVDKQDLNFTLLADEDHAIAEKYGVWQLKKFMGKEFMGVVRTTFIVGKDGRLINILGKFKTNNHDQVLLDTLDSVL